MTDDEIQAVGIDTVNIVPPIRGNPKQYYFQWSKNRSGAMTGSASASNYPLLYGGYHSEFNRGNRRYSGKPSSYLTVPSSLSPFPQSVRLPKPTIYLYSPPAWFPERWVRG